VLRSHLHAIILSSALGSAGPLMGICLAQASPEPQIIPAGIAVWDRIVYMSDTTNNSIVTRSADQASFELFLRDPKLQSPRGLAIDATFLYIADPVAHQVFRVNRSTKELLPLFPPNTPVTPIDLVSVPTVVDNTAKLSTIPSLAVLDSSTNSTVILTPYSDNNYLESSLGHQSGTPLAISRFGGRLLITASDTNTLYEGGATGSWEDVREEHTARSFAGANGLPRAPGYFFPDIQRPQSATGFEDFIYIVQGHRVYAYLPGQDRLISLIGKRPPPESLSRISVDTASNQLLLAGDSPDKLVNWPIKVPITVEVTAEGDVSTPLAELYTYLWDQGSLPTVSVELPISDGKHPTCRVPGCLVETVRALIPQMNAPMESLLCKLNPRLCTPKGMTSFRGGTSIRIPDAPFETYVAYAPIVFDGHRTLREYLTQLVPDDDLREPFTSNYVATYNTSAIPAVDSIPRKGLRLTLPVQHNRYFLSVNRSELFSSSSGLAELVTKYNTLSISPYGTGSRPAGSSDTAPEQAKHNIADLSIQRGATLSNLGYDVGHSASYGRANTVPVLIDEGQLDCQHPVFFGANSDDRAFDGPDCSNQKQASTPTFVDWSMSDPHHGTCVASIVGGRSAPYGPSLAPGAELGHLTQGDMTKTNLYNFYLKEKQPFIVNISNADSLVTAANKWRNLVSDTLGGQNVLFIAAAGNEAGLLKTKGDYPALMAREFPNVISVGALDKTGQTFWRGTSGEASNTGFKVELMAPGEAVPCAIDVSQGIALYSSVSGTSFAAPLVASVAALMLDKHMSPTEVKARLLATADPINERRNNEPLALFGRLNIENALLNPKVFHLNYKAPACIEGVSDSPGNCHADLDLLEQPSLTFVDPVEDLPTTIPVVFNYLLSIRKGSIDANSKQLFRLVLFTKGTNGSNSTIDLRTDVDLNGCMKVRSRQTGHKLILSFGNSCDDARLATDPTSILSDVNLLIAPTLGGAIVGPDH
jgi:Subtilase family